MKILKCSICKKEKSTNYFSKDSVRKRGFRSSCKLCDKKIRDSKELSLFKIALLEKRKLFKKGLKKCAGCKQIKNLSNFFKSKSSKDGLISYCRLCASEMSKKSHEKHRIKRNKTRRLHYYNNREKINLTNKNNRLKTKYGIDIKTYNKILNRQNGVCKICKNIETRKFNGKVCRLSVDHCHKTGKIRGLLCDSCNKGLGHFKDNILYIRNAIKYLNQ